MTFGSVTHEPQKTHNDFSDPLTLHLVSSSDCEILDRTTASPTTGGSTRVVPVVAILAVPDSAQLSFFLPVCSVFSFPISCPYVHRVKVPCLPLSSQIRENYSTEQ